MVNSSFAQGETWNWCFGDSAGIKFINGKTPVAVTSFKGWSYEGTSILNDNTGKVVLYSFSNYLYDSNHILQNKSFILKGGNSSCQPIQLIRHRKSKDVHIFTTSPEGGVSTDGFNHIVYNNGFKTTYKKIFRDIGEKQTSIFHQNNNDIWVTAHSLPNDSFYSFLLTKYGLIECPVINKIGAKYVDVYPTQGLLKFSPSGKYCANANWDLNRIELYRYDKENSKLYNLVTIVQTWPYAVEFSPDENYLYFTDRGKRFYQISLKNWNKDSVEKSKKLIATTNFETFSQLQLGPDKKIYVALYLEQYIGVINNPNNKDTFCSYRDKSIYLNGRTSEGGFPNFNAGYFFTPSIDFAYEQDCRTNTIAFEGRDTFISTKQNWIFKKGSSTTTKTGKDVSNAFADTGKWIVTYVAENGNRSDTVTKTITIRPKLEQGFLGDDKSYCQSLPTLKAPKNMHCIHWYNDTLMELGKADSFKTTKEGTYYAKATNLSFCVEWDTIKVSKQLAPKADFTGNDVCQNDSTAFINKSQNGTKYSWKFGDGNYSDEISPKHKYKINTTTTYNVTLVSKTDGCSDSITKQVTVNQNPNSGFTYTQTGNTFDLKAGTAGLKEYKWTFGNTDSISKTTETHTHTATSKDQSKICLKVSDISGCNSQTCTTVVLGIKPLLKEDDIKIYPNPNKGKLSIEISNAGNYTLKMYNESGQLVLEKGIKGNQSNFILLNEFKGNYLIEITDNKGYRISRKVLVE